MVAIASEAATGQELAQDASPQPWLTTTEARKRLGVSKRVLALLIRRNVLLQREYAYDRRVKQIARADVERVLREGVVGMCPPRRKGTTA